MKWNTLMFDTSLLDFEFTKDKQTTVHTIRRVNKEMVKTYRHYYLTLTLVPITAQRYLPRKRALSLNHNLSTDYRTNIFYDHRTNIFYVNTGIILTVSPSLDTN